MISTGDPIFSTWKNHTIFSTSIFDHFLHLDWTFLKNTKISTTALLWENTIFSTHFRGKYQILHTFRFQIINILYHRYRFWPQWGWIYYRFVVSLNVTVTIKDRDSPVPRLNIPVFTFRALLYRLMAFQHYSPELQLDSKN